MSALPPSARPTCMSKSPILSVAALLVAGLAICLQLLGTGESAPAPAPVSRGLEPAAELLARLDEIHASQLRLEERVSMLEVRDGGSRLPASVASQEELEELRDESFADDIQITEDMRSWSAAQARAFFENGGSHPEAAGAATVAAAAPHVIVAAPAASG